MRYIAIAAVSVDGVIGVGNDIPWHIPEDFKHFKNETLGNVLLVGRNTYLGLPEKALEGREYIILNGDFPIERARNNVYHFRDFETINNYLQNPNCNIEKVFIAGGAMVYNTLIDYCDEAIITWVNKNYPEGDKRFPIEKIFANFVLEKENGWQLSKNNFLYKITYYRRR